MYPGRQLSYGVRPQPPARRSSGAVNQLAGGAAERSAGSEPEPGSKLTQTLACPVGAMNERLKFRQNLYKAQRTSNDTRSANANRAATPCQTCSGARS